MIESSITCWTRTTHLDSTPSPFEALVYSLDSVYSREVLLVWLSIVDVFSSQTPAYEVLYHLHNLIHQQLNNGFGNSVTTFGSHKSPVHNS